MPATNPRSKAAIAYNKRHDNIMIRPSKEIGAQIREAAATENLSVQKFILKALAKYMNQQW